MAIVFSIRKFYTCGWWGGQEFQSKKIIDNISERTAYTRGICMLGAPTSTSYQEVQ